MANPDELVYVDNPSEPLESPWDDGDSNGSGSVDDEDDDGF